MGDWTVLDPDDPSLRPVYGPPCGVGPTGHRWNLAIEEGKVTLWTGCEECDAAVIDPVGGDDVWMDQAIGGRMEFVPDCSNLGGWHGLRRCDCGWSWRFVPEQIGPAR